MFRTVGQHVFQAIQEIEENGLARVPKSAVWRGSAPTAYDILNNRLAFVEGGKDDVLFLEQYVLLGNYLRDQDRFETVDAMLIDFLRESILAGEPGKRAERNVACAPETCGRRGGAAGRKSRAWKKSTTRWRASWSAPTA